MTEEEMLKGEGIIIKNNYLYAFNFAPTIESHRENLIDGDGFEIIAKIKINLTNEEQNELRENFKGSTNTANQIIKSIKSKSRRNWSSNQPAKNTKSNRGNAGLDKGLSQERIDQDRNNNSSPEYNEGDTRLVGTINVEESKAFGQEIK